MGAVNSRRAISAGAVLLLHLVLITIFIMTNYRAAQFTGGFKEIQLTLPPRLRRIVPPPALQPRLVSPVSPRVITAPQINILPGPGVGVPAPRSISGVGRALFGCNPAKLDLLSPEARAACQRLPAAKPREASVRLGPPPDPNSPFTKEIEERFRKANPINRPCPLGSYNDIRGLPCFGFDQESPLPPQR